jgi:2-polyprenyl-3-methyl-5-hydroxy-6-metoxy-1,4-benzoquinol methylase
MPALRTRRPSLQPSERGLAVRLRRAVGLRQTFTLNGVRYRELTTERLRHALSRQGPGFKDYDVMFPSGAASRIRATTQRIFADLVGPRLLPVYGRAEFLLRPGMRVLVLEAGTGYIAEWIAGLVAPSGAVVAIERDPAAVAYAQKRYPIANVSFESGSVEAIAGETDSAFSAVFAIDALRPEDSAPQVLRELWRVVSPGGHLIVGARANEPAPDPVEPTETAGGAHRHLRQALAEATLPDPAGTQLPAPISVLDDERDGWAIAIAAKPREHEHR